jgi:hypothetical protein
VQWGEACRREAVIRPLAEQEKVSRAAAVAAAEQLGMSRAMVYRLVASVSRPLPFESEAFGRLRRQERFESLAGVVKLLETGPGGEDQSRGDPNPFCCIYGPMSVSRRGEFLERLQSWPERVRIKALAAATSF